MTVLGELTTEIRNPVSMNIDTMSTMDMLATINNEDQKVAEAVSHSMRSIAMAVDEISERMAMGGRLFYVGSGTSGRLGVLDAAECPPTFGIAPEVVTAIISGNSESFTHAKEDAEDDAEAGSRCIDHYGITSKDAVIGLAASGRTPFVLGAVEAAVAKGILTVGFSNNRGSELERISDIAITVDVGPEVITGSTRMKSGTSQKLVLNMISTCVMIKLGKVYSNLMVDVQPKNVKLRDRAVRIIMDAVQTDMKTAGNVLEQAGMNPKAAIVMLKAKVDYAEAVKRLEDNKGHIALAIKKN